MAGRCPTTTIWIWACWQLMSSGADPWLYISNGDSVYVHEITRNESQLFIQDAGRVIDIAFGPNNAVYWIDGDTSSVFSVLHNNDRATSVGEKVAIVDIGLTSPNSLAVDWLTNNIYIVDVSSREIIVCSSKGDNCGTLKQVTRQPLEIAISSKFRRLYWTEVVADDEDRVPSGTVFEALLDGTGDHQIRNTCGRVSNLQLGPDQQTLFWMEVAGQQWRVYARTVDTGVVKIVSNLTSHLNSQPIMAISEDDVYICAGNQIVKVSKLTGKQIDRLTSLRNPVLTMRIYDKETTPDLKLGNQCHNFPCSHICVDVGNDVTAKCVCPVAMSLTSLNTCQAKPSRMFLASGYLGIFRLPTEYIGAEKYRAQLVLRAQAVAMAFDPTTQTVVFFEELLGKIQMFRLDNPSNVTSLYTAGYVEAIAVDSDRQVVYWTALQGEVYAGMMRTFNVTIVMRTPKKPRGITLDTRNRLMYIATWGSDAGILKCTMDGQQCDTIRKVPGGHPNMLVMVNDSLVQGPVLYWTDSSLDLVAGLNVDDPGQDIEIVVKGSIYSMHPFALVVTGDYFSFTDINSNTIHLVNRSNVTEERVISLGFGSLFSLVVLEPAPAHNNGSISIPESYLTPADSLNKTDTVSIVTAVVCGILLLVAIVVVLICWNLKRRHKSLVVFGMMRCVKASKSDDSRQLVSTSWLASKSFQNFEDLDYPGHYRPICTRRPEMTTPISREMSIISNDSAFVDRDSSSVDSSPLLI